MKGMKKLLSMLGVVAVAGAGATAAGVWAGTHKAVIPTPTPEQKGNKDLKIDLAEAEPDNTILLTTSDNLVEAISKDQFKLHGTAAKIVSVTENDSKTIKVSLDKSIDKNEHANINWTVPNFTADIDTDSLPESGKQATNEFVEITSASVNKDNFKLVELKADAPLSKAVEAGDITFSEGTQAKIGEVKGEVNSNTITLTLETPLAKTDKVNISLNGFANKTIGIDTSNIPAPAQAPAPQSFMAGDIPAVTFDKKPTQEEMAKDFEVKDGQGEIVEGVVYSFKEEVNSIKGFSLADTGITGTVTYKIPVKKDAPATQMSKPQPSEEAKKNNPKLAKAIAEAVEKAPEPVPFKEDSINLSGKGSMETIAGGSKDEIQACSYVSKENVLASLSNNKDVAKDVYEALFGKDNAPTDYSVALKDKWNNVSLHAATGMEINSTTVNKAFDSTNGREIPVYEVFPGNYIYQLGLSANGNYYWMNLGFDKIVSNRTPQRSSISDIQVQLPYGVQHEQEDGRHLTAKVTNMNDIAGCGDGTMKGMSAIYTHLRLAVSHNGGNNWDYVKYSDLSEAGKADQLPTDDQGNKLETWNRQDSLSWRSVFKMDGTLDLHWGNSWAVREGDFIKIDYTDLTGNKVESGAVEVKQAPIDVQKVTLSGTAKTTIYAPYGDTPNTHKVSSQSFADKTAIMNAITKDESLAKVVNKYLFSIKHDTNTTYAQELTSHANDIQIRAAKGMNITKENMTKEFDPANGKLIGLNEIIPGLSDYEIELSVGNTHFWMNLNFKKNLDGKLAQAKLDDEKAYIDFGDRTKGDLYLKVSNMDDLLGYDELPVIYTNMKVQINRKAYYAHADTICYTHYSAYGQELPEGTEMSYDDGNGIGLSSVFTKDGTLQLHWGKGFGNAWNGHWVWGLNPDEKDVYVTVEFTDLTGARQLITIDVFNQTASMKLVK